MLEGKQFKKDVLIKKPALETAAATTSTSGDQGQIESNTLKSARKNAIVITIAVLERESYTRKLTIMCEIPAPLVHWEGIAAKEMKSASSNSQWLAKQLEKNFIAHQISILEQLSKHEVLDACGFFAFLGMHANEVVLIAKDDDQYAQMAGVLALGLVARQRQSINET